jgi:hypothetical protein
MPLGVDIDSSVELLQPRSCDPALLKERTTVIGHFALSSKADCACRAKTKSPQVENELRQTKFEVLSREEHFIERDPEGECWCLIVASKP